MELSLIIGIGGTLLGAIMGALGSYLSSKKILQEQFSREERKIDIEQQNKKKLLIRVISTILKQEIINNQDGMPLNMCNSIKEKLEIVKTKGIAQQYRVADIDNRIKVDMYEEMKWELMKYSGDPMILDIIELYNDFYLIKRGFDIYTMKVKEIERISTLEDRIIELLDKLI